MRETLKIWKSQEIKPVPLNRRCGQFAVFRHDVPTDFKPITKMESNQSLHQVNATVKNGKGEPCGFSSYVGLCAGLNCYINDSPISHNWCLIKDPAFTKQQHFRWSSKKNLTEKDVTKQLNN